VKVLVVSSVGGHLEEAMVLIEHLRSMEVVLVVNDSCAIPAFPFSRVYRIVHSERDWRTLVNFHEGARILLEEQPDVVFSTGAGPAVPFFFLARMAGIRTVYLETAASVSRLSVTGRFLRNVADEFFIQWPLLARAVPRAHLVRLVFP
jgi:UDP-N-acetylglucosamine:LPS N-acetylglucosamine transferase